MKAVKLIRPWNDIPVGKVLSLYDHVADSMCEGDDPVAVPFVPLDDMTVDQLKDELRARDLKVSGTKDELIARLRAHE